MLLPPTTVLVTMPELAITVTTSVKFEVVPLGNDAKLQLIAPLAPTAGVVQLHPPGALSDWNPTEPSRVWLNVAFAASGPLFVIDCV